MVSKGRSSSGFNEGASERQNNIYKLKKKKEEKKI
jgi:hypothetical protein